MIKSYRVRLLPNQKQEQLLWKHINTSRFVGILVYPTKKIYIRTKKNI